MNNWDSNSYLSEAAAKAMNASQTEDELKTENDEEELESFYATGSDYDLGPDIKEKVNT